MEQRPRLRGNQPEADLLIVGGGPAGASAAIHARAQGLDVRLLEAARFPRHHVGESLVMVWPVLDRLGVAAEMDATFQHKYGSCRVWGREPELRWTGFESGLWSRGYSLQVERSRFDEILLRRASEAGADVLEGCRAEAVVWRSERAVGVRYRDPLGRKRVARARWILDASGRRGLIAAERRLRRVDPFYPDLSVYGYFHGTRRFPGDREGHLLIEAVPAGWLWFIPLHTGATSVGLVCDRDSRGALRASGVRRYLEAAIASSRVVRDRLREAALAAEPIATASYGYHSARYAGPGWLVAGDAGSFVDPMWATGVAHALSDGILAAATVAAVATGGVAEADAVSHYDRELRTRAEFALPLVRFVYRANRLHAGAPFWQARRRAAAGVDPAPADLMRQLARDPSRRYFRDAFHGMGVEAEVLAPLAERLDRLANRDREVAPLLGNLDLWRPALRPGVTLRRRLGLDEEYRLVPGVAADNDGVAEFTADPVAAIALGCADGRTTARDLVTRASASVPPGRRLRTRFALLATLVDAHQRGVLVDAGVG